MTDDWHAYLEDAAHYPGGHAAGVVFPRTTAEVVEIVTGAAAVLPIGAQSSLTGGATPMGELIVATSRMSRLTDVTSHRITVEPGVTVAAMQEALAAVDGWFPPAPTFSGACAGGIVATNAAGAATFKYGSTRDWVEGLTVVLADGTVLELVRGGQRASPQGFEIETRRGRITVPVPSYRMPAVAKRSAGYHAAPGMDLIDLFIGSEGTLGVITAITFRALSPAPRIALALVPCRTEPEALALVNELRDASRQTWQTNDPCGLDASAMEHLDRRSIEVVREDGADRRLGVTLPQHTEVALLVQLEVHARGDAAAAFDDIEAALSPDARDSPLTRFCRILDRADLLGDCELVLPENRRRAEALIALREAVPLGVNRRIGDAKRMYDARIEKTAADMIVPFDRFGEMMAAYRRGFAQRGLDFAVWGHISDGNVHPNVIPRSYDDVEKGKDAILEFGREVARLGGCPLAEHGVGRNPTKQALLRQLYGTEGIEEMHAVKRALDPHWKLSPGVLFEG